ncbi:AAA family ATPase [Streptomyces sp. NPDC050610]|uniref:helix-turn-helix transcriptional regulator n=1 Tax=Streptomyces sp. NPDC050610 TaxID=3157097 RepID=UPI00342D66F3
MLGDVRITSVSPVFVGRAAELTALTGTLDRAAAGEPQALLVGGEAGVGKTRLVEEFLTAARADGAVTAVGGCVEIGADGLPFAPVSTALRALRRQLGDALAEAAAGQEGELARLLPELGETARESRGEDGRARLFELTARLLERLAADRTLVVALEDLHWADRSTRELLGYLLRSLDRARLVIVATYRSDDIHRRHPLRPFLAELDRMRTVHRVELPRFTRAEVGDQLAGITGSRPGRPLLDRVFERSDGNAFFVEELARSLADGVRAGLSESLRDLLLVRVEALPEDVQRVVRAAAEGGSAVEYDLLRAVAGLDEDALIEALRTAVGAGILLPTPDGDGYRFRHSLVREAVGEDLLPGERSRLNRRYARALESDPAAVRAEERPARLASYWYHAHDAAKALPAALEAAVHSRRRYAYAEQLRLLERALELWEIAPADVREAQRPIDHADGYPARGRDGEALRHLDLLAEAVVAAYLSGDEERALAVIKWALRELDEERAPLRAAWFWNQRAKLMEGLARGDGRAELDRARELVRGMPPSSVHADVLALTAALDATHTPGPETFGMAERAIELARLVGAEGIELNARLTLGGLTVEAGDVAGGLAEMRAVHDRVVELGRAGVLSHIGVLGRCYTNLASALEGVGRSAEAVEVTAEGIEVLAGFGLSDAQAWAYGNQADSLYSLGRWDEVERAALKVRRLARSAKPRATAASRLTRIALARGDWATAERELARAREHYGSHDLQPQHTLVLARFTLELAAARGRIDDVRATLDEVLATGIPPTAGRYAWPLLLAAATAEADARGLPRAEEGRAEALRRIGRAAKGIAQPVPLWRAYALLLEAEIRRAEGTGDAGRWMAAATALEPLERPYELARARHRWAEALLAGGGGAAREQAAGLLARAHDVAVGLGARPLCEDLEQLAARARLPLDGPPAGKSVGKSAGKPAASSRPADPAESLGLTRRERDVLRLVAAGRSNRQIAEELFISPKTASVHVSNILAKLGVSGRGEAGALAHRLRLFSAPESA